MSGSLDVADRLATLITQCTSLYSSRRLRDFLSSAPSLHQLILSWNNECCSAMKYAILSGRTDAVRVLCTFRELRDFAWYPFSGCADPLSPVELAVTTDCKFDLLAALLAGLHAPQRSLDRALIRALLKGRLDLVRALFHHNASPSALLELQSQTLCDLDAGKVCDESTLVCSALCDVMREAPLDCLRTALDRLSTVPSLEDWFCELHSPAHHALQEAHMDRLILLVDLCPALVCGLRLAPLTVVLSHWMRTDQDHDTMEPVLVECALREVTTAQWRGYPNSLHFSLLHLLANNTAATAAMVTDVDLAEEQLDRLVGGVLVAGAECNELVQCPQAAAFETILLAAVRADNLPFVDSFLRCAAFSPEQLALLGPLNLAVHLDKLEMTRLLLSYGADPDLYLIRPTVADDLTESVPSSLPWPTAEIGVHEARGPAAPATTEFLTPLHVALLRSSSGCGVWVVEMVEALLDGGASANSDRLALPYLWLLLYREQEKLETSVRPSEHTQRLTDLLMENGYRVNRLHSGHFAAMACSTLGAPHLVFWFLRLGGRLSSDTRLSSCVWRGARHPALLIALSRIELHSHKDTADYLRAVPYNVRHNYRCWETFHQWFMRLTQTPQPLKLLCRKVAHKHLNHTEVMQVVPFRLRSYLRFEEEEEEFRANLTVYEEELASRS